MMQIDAFIFQLLILLIPGFICFSIFRKIAVYRRDSKKNFGFQEIIIIIVYSLIICMFYDLFCALINYLAKKDYSFTLSKLVDIEMYNAIELSLLCLIAIISGYLFSILETHKIINKIAMSLRVTNYYGDTDVWTSFCANENTNWIYARDHKLNLIYYGLLEQYSDPGEERELIITNVRVFSENGDFCYNCPKMYICRQANEITLEIPQTGKGDEDGKIIVEGV
ncbi:hypothetical protein AGMMS50293_09860 [Spirochaetia bacterium]|nr:hypothetical protein AGMMS50293_09860 [Spirochaetia bacterium]